MHRLPSIEVLSQATEAILAPPFEWCYVDGGNVTLADASHYGGTVGGDYRITAFAVAKYPITNAQYQRFIDDPGGHADHRWWDYSSQAAQWRKDHRNPRPTAFGGADLPRTRVSWFDSMAFCAWLSASLESQESALRSNALDVRNLATWRVRLPIEQEWQRAALGDAGWQYPWGDHLDERHGNFGGNVGQPTRVGCYPEGQSSCGAMDMVGNVWEWCLTAWGVEGVDASGYIYRVIKGGAWNVSNPEHLRATDRGGHPPRGRLNDCGFRCVYCVTSQLSV